MNKVLVVTYHFPPSGGSKTRRTLKILKYLARLQWIPIVLTSRSSTRFGFDPSLFAFVPPEAKLHRAFDLSGLLKTLPSRRARVSSVGANMKNPNKVRFIKTLTELCRQAILRVGRFTAIPDVFAILWGPFALWEGLRTARREYTQVIYSTGPPFSNHIVGALLKRITRTPLLVDFRDGWTADPVRRMKYPAARQPIERLLEKFVIRNADVVVATTEGLTRDFRSRYGRGCEEKFITLPNGFDREEFSLPLNKDTEPREKLRIVHTGHLRLERSPKPLLAALRRLFDENPACEQCVEVVLVGESQAFLDGRTLDDYLKEFRLEAAVKVIDHVPQAEAIRYQVSADILLLVIGVVPPEQVSTYGIASKVFDYMIAGKPVLTLADPGPVRDLVEKTRIGPAFAPSEIEAVKDYLLRALEEFREGRLQVRSDQAEIERYDFRELTRQLSEQFLILTHRRAA